MSGTRYVVISPVRNEGHHLPKTISSLGAQTIQPEEWIIVNDGSSDDTALIADAAARSQSWISVFHRADRGSRKAGSGVMEAFYDGFDRLRNAEWDFLVKLDGDMSFEPDYFEACFEAFARNARLGIAGGTVCVERNGNLETESKGDPRFHVRGATKIYRRKCWDELGGLIRLPGWDTMDEIKANMLGWETATLAGQRITHHRPTGAAYGSWQDRVKNGLGCYLVGYHPLFMLIKSLKRVGDRPYIVGACGLMFGFIKGYLSRAPRIKERNVIRYLRKQQMNRLFFRKSLWDA